MAFVAFYITFCRSDLRIATLPHRMDTKTLERRQVYSKATYDMFQHIDFFLFSITLDTEYGSIPISCRNVNPMNTTLKYQNPFRVFSDLDRSSDSDNKDLLNLKDKTLIL